MTKIWALCAIQYTNCFMLPLFIFTTFYRWGNQDTECVSNCLWSQGHRWEVGWDRKSGSWVSGPKVLGNYAIVLLTRMFLISLCHFAVLTRWDHVFIEFLINVYMVLCSTYSSNVISKYFSHWATVFKCNITIGCLVFW